MGKRIILIFLVCMLFIPNNIYAKTLGELRKELVELQNKKNDNTNKKNLTQNEINAANNRIGIINDNIVKNEDNISKLNNEIAELEIKSKEKEDEIKDVVYFMQVTNSENAYLEYIFNSTTIEDLILRSAISEQLANYNDELIKDYNNTIELNNNKKTLLNEEIESLNQEKVSLRKEAEALGDKLIQFKDIQVDIDKDIESQKKMIDYYVSLGCKDNEDVNTCVKIPYSNRLLRPIKSGNITSNYGMRFHPTKKYYTMHEGVDMYGNESVYAAGPGIVKGYIQKSSCGGNILIIAHNVNGTYYSTIYMHLYKIYVKVGDYVDQNTKIAAMGGDWRTPWDSCSTGTHLHFGTAIGSYSTYASFVKNLINPRTIVNFPSGSGWWSDRTKVF